MLTKIEADDLQGHTLALPLRASNRNYTVANIDGLDPVKSTIVASSFAQLDGTQFQSAKREARNIVMKIAIEPYNGISTVEDLRAVLYEYFMPKSTVNLKFYIDDVLTYVIQGQVESCDAPLFTKDPAVTVSIVCFDPNFLAPAPVTVLGNTVSGSTEMTVNALGNIETGYLLTVNVNRSISGFSTYMRRPNGDVSTMDVALALVNGDVVKISTEFQDKSITLTRAGVTSSILYAASIQSKWGVLFPGTNYHRVAVSGVSIPYSIVYTPKYGGL